MDHFSGKSVLEKVNVKSGFARPSDVIDDVERPGLLRIKTRPFDSDPAEMLDFQNFDAFDWSASSAPQLNLETMGFDCIELSPRPKLLTCLEDVRQSNYLSEGNIRIIRKQLTGKRFLLSNGKRLRLLFIAPEGFILRKGGPNSLNIAPDEVLSASNGHTSAPVMHGDQDVYGTPIKQILKGFAPWLFRHKTPDGANKKSPIFLLNVWVPLQQITQPLGLLDRRTLDNKKHQLRYALPTDSFLDRDDDMALNDIWSILYDKEQRWYFNSHLQIGKAYVFDTLGEPHGGLTLAGEEVIEQYFLRLQKAIKAISNKEVAALKSAVSQQFLTLPAVTTAPIKKVTGLMEALMHEAYEMNIEALEQSDWCNRADKIMDSVVRKSIEMRAVALVY